jgi:hypothetical protein
VDHTWLWLFGALRKDRTRLLCLVQHRLRNRRHADCPIALHCSAVIGSVFLEVHSQVGLVTCLVLAVGALEWLLASVFPKVFLQVGVSRCLIVAFGAVVHDHSDDLSGSTRQPQSATCTAVKLQTAWPSAQSRKYP